MEATSTLFYSLPAFALILFLGRYPIRYFRSVKQRQAERRKCAVVRKRAIVQVKFLAKMIRCAVRHSSSQEDKDIAEEHMRQITELVNRYGLSYLKDIGVNEATLRRFTYMATVDDAEAEKKLALIRQGKFGFTTKWSDPLPLPQNVIPLHGYQVAKTGDGDSKKDIAIKPPLSDDIARDISDGTLVPVEEFPEDKIFDVIVIDGHSDIYAFREEDGNGEVSPEPDVILLRDELVDEEIIMEDPDTGIIVMIDLSEMEASRRRALPPAPKTPYTWDDEVDTDAVVEEFFADKVAN